MDVLDEIIAESTPAESYQIQTGETDRFFTGDDIWRNVLRETASALYHHVTADMAKLMAEHCGTNDSVVINGDFTGQFGRITYDKTTSENAIVGNMHILHQQVIATDSSGSFGGCTTGDGYILPDAVVVTKHTDGLFSLEF